MFGCFVHDLWNARASFRGLHPGTDRRRSRLPHGNWPLTPRIITQVTCVKGNVMFFDRGPDSETPRNKTVWVYALREKGEVVALRTLLCNVLCTRSHFFRQTPGATARSAWYSRKYLPDSQRCSLFPFRWRTRSRYESLRQSPGSTWSTVRTASRFE